jgi:hypothetical protein
MQIILGNVAQLRCLSTPTLYHKIDENPSKNHLVVANLAMGDCTRPMLAKNVQQDLTYTSLRTVTAAVEIWYDPDPSETIIDEESQSLR